MEYEIGMVGLGVMGRNLLLNMADHGYSVVGFDTDKSKVEALRQEGKNQKILGVENVQDFIKSLRRPRAAMLLVPAGAPVDIVINELAPHMEKGDIIIDAGNSYYKDTDVREMKLAKQGIYFFGVGVSGGEEGARRGPSMMPGGPKEAYQRIKPVLEATAAKVNGEPCVSYLGPQSAGHFVKMVHNGIEYGIMQLISEAYDLMKRGLGLTDDELYQVFAQWNKGELNSYLLEITSLIFNKTDEKTGKKLIDVISDVAKQNGTGMWTSQSAMEMKVPLHVIDLSVAARSLSMIEEQRKKANQILKQKINRFEGDRNAFIQQLKSAFHAAMIVAYAQGMSLLKVASDELGYQLNLETVARIWRGGCIIRAALLEDIRKAFKKDANLPNLLLDSDLANRVLANEGNLRNIIGAGVKMGLPLPGFMATLSYLDGYRSAWLPSNLIQAQRDFFGSHTYERIDGKGTFHTEWEIMKKPAAEKQYSMAGSR
jgi:6-phosphogluconate dehydrogenase